MRVTVIQMSPGDDLHANLREARRLVGAAVRADRSDLVILPETWSCLGGSRETKLSAAVALPALGSAPEEGGLYVELQRLAREHHVTLHCGSVGERSDGQLYNTSLVFDPDGQEIARYRKIHLFDITTPNGTGYRESDLYGRGDAVVLFDVGDVRAGCAICYDLRFPALFSQMRDRGAELVILPSAFTAETGQAHWETLIRARAIETQCWLAAAATTGRHHDGEGRARFTHGHSMVVDPWGTMVATASRGVGWVTAVLDQKLTAVIRRDMPVWEHRRLGA